MDGIGPPLVTPFDADGDVDHDRLRDLVARVESAGVDFLVPCGSTSEAELLTAEERERVIETVVDASSVPVVAGTGHPGLHETLETTRAANRAGADAALVVTPFYYPHDQATLAAYYREVASAVDLPIYCYSVPAFTGVALDPETIGDLATHPAIVGVKDSSGSLQAFVRTVRRAEADFDCLVGSASILAQALTAGASGGILALANLLPGRCVEIYDASRDDPALARERNAELVELNRAVTTAYGVPGLKFAMRERGVPAGRVRSPHRDLEDEERAHVRELLAAVS